jgi:predicted phage tail protein
MAKINLTGKNRINSPNRNESVVVYDLLSEGPVAGLIDKGIYLDGAPIESGTGNINTLPTISSDVDYVASTNTITDNNAVLVQKVDTSRTQYIRVKGAKKRYTSSDGTITIGTNGNVITTSTSFFASNDASVANLPFSLINFVGAGNDSTTITRKIVGHQANGSGGDSIILDKAIDPTTTITEMTVDLVGTVSSINSGNNTIVLATISDYGTTDRDVTAVNCTLSTPVVDFASAEGTYVAKNAKYNFRKGTRGQGIISTRADIGSAGLIYSPGQDIQQTDLSTLGVSVDNEVSGGYESTTDDATAALDAVTVTPTNLKVGNQIGEVDLIKLTFQFPQMYHIRESNGTEGRSFVEFRILLQYRPVGFTGSMKEVLVYGPTGTELSNRTTGYATHNLDNGSGQGYSSGHVQAQSKTPFIEQFEIDLTPYQPLSDFKVIVQRVNPPNAKARGRRHYNPSTLKTAEAVIMDKLSYPYASYAGITFDASNFSNIPERKYHMRGLRVKVPTNYFARHERGNGTLATYNRNVSTGAAASEYQNWDGNFRGDVSTFNGTSPNRDLVWTDNPVWILYDLLTNERYGLGEYVSESDIDKYEFFRLARFCDEEVPDGAGGTEPRFTLNTWIVERKEAYKMIQDISGVFRGMLHWINGSILPSANREKESVYTFSKSNIINGEFTYQSTKSRNRHNSIVVTWVDPKQLYTTNVEIVEDTNNILETQEIRTKEVLAYGCTSRSQAHRFGKWYLYSELLEKEVVTFASGLNASHLKVGDVIEVQDADRDNIRFSGRCSTGSTTTAIELDSAVDVSSGNTFYLSLIYPTGVAYLAQDRATISSTVYVRGDIISTDGDSVSINSATAASNAVDDSGDKIELVWSGDSHTERQQITTTSSNATTLNVSSAFSSAPSQNTVWGIVEYEDEEKQAGSLKEYMITDVSEDSSDQIYTFTASEYAREKFQQVDRGYTVYDVPDVNRPPDYTTAVPEPKNLLLL